jgi:hypothetical protein
MIEVVGLECQPADIIDGFDIGRAAGVDALCVGAIRRDHFRHQAKAPRGKQAIDAAVIRHAGRIELTRMKPLGFRIGIDEHQGSPALEHELIDGVERLIGKLLRMHQHQHVDIARNRVEIGAERFDGVELLHLFEHDVRHQRATLHRRHQVAFEWQLRGETNDRLVRIGKAGDELRQVIFEESLAIRLKERDDRLVVSRIGAGEAEINLLAALIERHALEAEGDGAILDRRERLRIENIEHDLAFGQRRVFAQHLAHAIGKDAVTRDFAAELRRIIETQRDRLVDFGERGARRRRQRIESFLRQVDPHAGEPVSGDDVDGNEKHDRRGDREERDGAARHAKVHRPPQSAFFSSTMAAFA